jgi:hypothetical protein
MGRLSTGDGIEVIDNTPEGQFRFTEVKALHPEADSISVTRNEIVDDGEAQEPVYVEEPWEMELDFHVTSVWFEMDELLSKANRSETIRWGTER